MVEHDRREQFAFAKVTPGIAQATELERIAKPSFWGPRIGNGGKVGGIETMVLDHRLLGVRQCQQRSALLPGHWHTGGPRKTPPTTPSHFPTLRNRLFNHPTAHHPSHPNQPMT